MKKRFDKFTWLIVIFFVGHIEVLGCIPNHQIRESRDLDSLILKKSLTISSYIKEALIGDFSGLAVDNQGIIYASDTKLQKIHFFSPDGKYLGSLGHKGKGPGEFVNLDPQIRIQSNNLYALQKNTHRIELFSLQSHSYIRTIKIPDTKIGNVPLGNLKDIFPLSNGELLAVFVNPYFKKPNLQNKTHFLTISKLDKYGNFIKKKILQLPALFPTNQKIVLFAERQMSIFFGLFYPDIRISADNRGQIYMGKTDSLLIRSYNTQGRIREVLRYPYQRIPLTGEDIDSIAQKKTRGFKKAVKQAGIPEYWPVFQNFLIDDVGDIWIKLLDPNKADQSWWIFNNKGRLKWKIKLPSDVELYEIKKGKAYGIFNSDDNVSSIYCYDLNFKNSK